MADDELMHMQSMTSCLMYDHGDFQGGCDRFAALQPLVTPRACWGSAGWRTNHLRHQRAPFRARTPAPAEGREEEARPEQVDHWIAITDRTMIQCAITARARCGRAAGDNDEQIDG